MVTVTTYIQDGKKFEQHKHKLRRFPNYTDMLRICKQDNIKASDFSHKYKNKERTFFEGRFIVAGGKNGVVHTGRYGLKFLVRCDEKPTYEELVR